MKFNSLPLGLLAAAQTAASLNFLMYADEYHTQGLPDSTLTAGISHAIMAFARSTQFNGTAPHPWTPFEPVETFRKRFGKDTKVLAAIGGWGESAGFYEGVKDEAAMALYAKNVRAMVDEFGLDGIDVDWEYPGGNGADYKQIPNSEKTGEIESYPRFLAAIRKALGKDKLLTIAVPGKRGDMIAYTKEQGPKIWESVDMVNIMTYDLMNRRDTVTAHHTDIKGSLDSIAAYEEIGLDPKKINLGFAYYAKWFTTKEGAGCETNPLGCEVVLLEDEQGQDTGRSGAFTFEKANLEAPPPNIGLSTDGSCGAGKGKCGDGQCCSQYGSCGTTDAHCLTGCRSDYGTCKGMSLIDSWRRAEKDGVTDEEAGGQYYFDKEASLFWTWDTAPLIQRKFKEIVDAKKIGGIMAWSLAEDSYQWEHLKAMQQGFQERS